jgi:hypothetical protein
MVIFELHFISFSGDGGGIWPIIDNYFLAFVADKNFATLTINFTGATIVWHYAT